MNNKNIKFIYDYIDKKILRCSKKNDYMNMKLFKILFILEMFR